MYAHFIKFDLGLSWRTLLIHKEEQFNRNCKMLKYNRIAEINMPAEKFSSICDNIPLFIPEIIPYTDMSRVDSQGVFNCIIVCSNDDARKFAFYTSGRPYPLYVAAL